MIAGPPGPGDVRAVAAVCRAALEARSGADWGARAGDLEWTARETLEHIIEGLTFYARDLATPVLSVSDDELRLVCAADSTVPGMVEGLGHLAAVVAAVVVGTPAEVRAYHPDGMADPTGFAAMACDEMLIHTDDIVAGLGGTFGPPADVCERVLARLFPWAPAGGDAWQRLRWANGRTALPDRPRLGSGWSWHAAPVDEWDGAVPTSGT